MRGKQPQAAQRVTALGRPSAIERGGGAGQFISRGGAQPQNVFGQGQALGAIPLANARSIQQPSLLPPRPQVSPVQSTLGQRRPRHLAQNQGQGNQEMPPQANRQAWGQLKKQDAAELSVYLAEIEAQMIDADIPPGIVTQIRTRLEAFVADPAAGEEIALTPEEVTGLENAIMNLNTGNGTGNGAEEPSFGKVAAVVALFGLVTVAVTG